MKELWFPYLILHDNQNINFYKARPAFPYSNRLVFIHCISKLLFMARPLVNVEFLLGLFKRSKEHFTNSKFKTR